MEYKLFQGSQEKGRTEWSAFNTVRDDRSDAYEVALPKRPVVIREQERVLRIVYPLRHA